MNTARKSSQKRRLTILTSIFCLLLFTVGCTPTLQKNLDAFQLSDLIQVTNVKEALLAHAFAGSCNWKGLEHFKSYVWSSVVTHNLVMMARLQTT